MFLNHCHFYFSAVRCTSSPNLCPGHCPFCSFVLRTRIKNAQLPHKLGTSSHKNLPCCVLRNCFLPGSQISGNAASGKGLNKTTQSVHMWWYTSWHSGRPSSQTPRFSQCRKASRCGLGKYTQIGVSREDLG